MAAEQRVDTKTEQTESVQVSLEEQFAKFEADSRKDFDKIGWKEFKDRIIKYENDLYFGTRRECLERDDNQLTLTFSGKDVERASMWLDIQRFQRRKKKRHGLQLGALVCGILTGIIATWAFTNFTGKTPSLWPWIILLIVFGLLIVLSSLSFSKDMEL